MRAWLWVFSVVLGCSSATPTQTVVFVYAKPGDADDANVLYVEVLGEGATVLSQRVEADRTAELLARIPIIPRDGDVTRTFEIEARLSSPTGVVSVLRVGGGFRRGDVQEIHAQFDLSAECQAEPDCGPGRTCVDGACVGSCFGLAEGEPRVRPDCGVCERCNRAACEPVEEGAACGCGDICRDGVCDVRDEAMSLSLGEHVTCAAVGSSRYNALACWGNNRACRAGLPCSERASDVPRLLDLDGQELRYPENAALGADHGCALWRPVEGVVERSCWGWANDGAVGIDGVSGLAEPTSASSSDPITEGLRAGRFQTCGLDDDGHVYCWGRNDHGSLGQPEIEGESSIFGSPTRVEGLPAISQLALGWGSSCAREREGARRVYCWGNNSSGQRGDGGGEQGTHEPQCVIDATGECIEGVRELAGKWQTYCALRVVRGAPPLSGELWCWGNNDGRFNGSGDASPVAAPVAEGWTWTSAVPAEGFICGIRASDDPSLDGGLYCWGVNDEGTLGLGDRRSRTEPTRVEVEHQDRWLEVDAGPGYACAIRDNGSLWCWGSNDGRTTSGPESACTAAGRLGLGLGADPGTAPCGEPNPEPTEANLLARTDVLTPRRVCVGTE